LPVRRSYGTWTESFWRPSILFVHPILQTKCEVKLVPEFCLFAEAENPPYALVTVCTALLFFPALPYSICRALFYGRPVKVSIFTDSWFPTTVLVRFFFGKSRAPSRGLQYLLFSPFRRSFHHWFFSPKQSKKHL